MVARESWIGGWEKRRGGAKGGRGCGVSFHFWNRRDCGTVVEPFVGVWAVLTAVKWRETVEARKPFEDIAIRLK